MSMLAERKRKVKWVINPTKKPLWTTDSVGVKLGMHLMEKMGWSAGKGLGASEQGIQEPLKVSFKNDTKGMGFKGNDENWIEYQDEFNKLLSQLSNNADCPSDKANEVKKNKIQSLEEKSRNSRARVHYQKFTRGKDLSRYSENDLACILGSNKIKKQKIVSEENEKCLGNNFDKSFGVTTVNGGSIQDYFKQKVTSLKLKKNNSQKISDEPTQDDMNTFNSEEPYCNEYEENEVKEEDEQRKIKKKKYNLSSNDEFSGNEDGNNIQTLHDFRESNFIQSVNEIEKPKKKKKNKCESENVPKKKKRKTDGCDGNTSIQIDECTNEKILDVKTIAKCENEVNTKHVKVEVSEIDNCGESDVGISIIKAKKNKKKSKEKVDEKVKEEKKKEKKLKKIREMEEFNEINSVSTALGKSNENLKKINISDEESSKNEKTEEEFILGDTNESVSSKKGSVKKRKKKEKLDQSEVEQEGKLKRIEKQAGVEILKEDKNEGTQYQENEIYNKKEAEKIFNEDGRSKKKNLETNQNSENFTKVGYDNKNSQICETEKTDCINVTKSEGEKVNVVHSHKVELFKNKKLLQLLPKNYTNDRVLNLICGAEIHKFRGSNLGLFLGYGMRRNK